MKVTVIYRNGKSQSYVGVEIVQPIKNADGKTEAIYIEGFNFASRLERPPLYPRHSDIEKVEIHF